MTCTWKGCGAKADMIERVEGRPVAVLCYEHEWAFMKRVGELVNEAERIEGWGKFCAERGYDPEAATFALATSHPHAEEGD